MLNTHPLVWANCSNPFHLCSQFPPQLQPRGSCQHLSSARLQLPPGLFSTSPAPFCHPSSCSGSHPSPALLSPLQDWAVLGNSQLHWKPESVGAAGPGWSWSLRNSHSVLPWQPFYVLGLLLGFGRGFWGFGVFLVRVYFKKLKNVLFCQNKSYDFCFI